MLLEDPIRRNARIDHRRLDDHALGLLRAGRHAAADNRPAEKALTPEPRGGLGAQRDVLTGAEQKQQIGRLERRIDQMGAIDLGDLVRRRQARAAIP